MKRHYFTAIAVTGLLTTAVGFGQLRTAQAQDAPPPPPAGERGAPPPPDGAPRPGRGPKDGPGPRGERPPRPDDGPEATQPVDPQAAPVAVKTATDALAGLSAGQVWTRTAPRGEQQVQATLMFQGKEIARLEFDPANGSLLTRGQRLPVPPPAPGEDRGPAARPNVPPAPAADADKPGNIPVPPAPGVEAPRPAAPPVNLDLIKAKLPETVKGLSIGQGAEIMPREGFWKVPLIYQNRVVGELRLSADGTKVIQDFGASRDAAIFAR